MPAIRNFVLPLTFTVWGLFSGLSAQTGPSPIPEQTPAAPLSSVQEIRSTYVLGPDDQVTIQAVDADEIGDKAYRVDGNGYLRIPLAGRVKASGLTVEQLEAAISEQLKVYIKDPQVSVSVSEFHSQPVSVIGEVRAPGLHQLEGHKTLVEMISLAGGLADDADHTVKLTRHLEWGRIPLPGAANDPTNQYSVADVNLDQIMNAKDPAENITIAPDDVITVQKAKMVYVIGTILKPGGYILDDQSSFSVLKVVSMAGGLDKYAAPQKAHIMRLVPGSSTREEIAVNVKAIMAGSSADIPLRPEDILYIPVSGGAKALARTAEEMLQLSSTAIYRF